MKEVQIDEAIRRDRKLLEDVERATALLEEEVESSASEVNAKWSLERLAHERLVKIEVSDGDSHAAEFFTEDELSRITRFGLRLILLRLWGHLLKELSHHQMAKLRIAVQSLDGD